jgi:hypothetical protein
MDIIDYNKVFNIAEDQNNDKHYLAPKWPFRLLILGPTGCGKTNLLINLIDNISHDKLIIYSRHLDQPLYRAFIEKGKHENISMSSDIDNVLNPDDLDTEKQNLYIFDDFMTSKDQNDIIDVFVRGRHANCSCIYITQCYFPVHKNIRLNCNYFVIFKIDSKRELLELQKDHAINIGKDDFLKLYMHAVSEPYSFFVIDKRTNFPPLSYRRRFDGLSSIYFLNN